MMKGIYVSAQRENAAGGYGEIYHKINNRRSREKIRSMDIYKKMKKMLQSMEGINSLT